MKDFQNKIVTLFRLLMVFVLIARLMVVDVNVPLI